MTEKRILETVQILLEHHGWTCIRKSPAAFVRAENVLPVTVKKEEGFVELPPGWAQFFFAEFKRPNTLRWQEEQQAYGLLAYRCPDGCGDPVEHFKAWYEGQFREAL